VGGGGGERKREREESCLGLVLVVSRSYLGLVSVLSRSCLTQLSLLEVERSTSDNLKKLPFSMKGMYRLKILCTQLPEKKKKNDNRFKMSHIRAHNYYC
jgi:hypothetical protein